MTRIVTAMTMTTKNLLQSEQTWNQVALDVMWPVLGKECVLCKDDEPVVDSRFDTPLSPARPDRVF
ncbi:MAG: hypothetical protein OXU40_10260 [Nitrospira sp.]|nr:hypothetical protein [Nitrospira sp.]